MASLKAEKPASTQPPVQARNDGPKSTGSSTKAPASKPAPKKAESKPQPKKKGSGSKK